MKRQLTRRCEDWRWMAGMGLCMLGCMLSAVQAQTYGWRTGQSMVGVDGAVSKAVAWDPDGAGPQPEMLVVSGAFRLAGGTETSGIAAYDGQQWHALGSGVNPSGPLVIWNGQPVAAMYNGATYQVCNWDGVVWQPMGLQEFTRINALRVCNGELVAAGSFPAHGVARWDGSQWQRVGEVLAQAPLDIVEFNGSMACGARYLTMSGVGAVYWTGSTWQPLMGQTGDDIILYEISRLAVYDGRLIGMGKFPTLNGPTHSIAAWDGLHWQPMPGTYNSGSFLAVCNGQLFANGSVWDGQQWQVLPGYPAGGLSLDDMSAFGGKLAFVGSFVTVGVVPANNIVLFDGSTWQPLAGQIDATVLCVADYNGALLASGYFQTMGGVACNGIARFDGAQWSPLGAGPVGNSPTYVQAMAVYNGNLVAAGRFATMDGVFCNNIARFDGQQWHAMGSGTDSAILALTVFNGDLIAVGTFTSMDGIPCGRVARFDGQQWHAMGNGIAIADSDLYAVAVHNGQLAVGGEYTVTIPKQLPVHYGLIYTWDGQQWQPQGEQPDRAVLAMASYDGQLVAGGAFSKFGAAAARGIASWDGSSWQQVGTAGVGYVRALGLYNGDLIATGAFTAASGVTCNGIARWDGQQWNAMGSGLGEQGQWAYGNTLAVHGQDLLVGGMFSMPGGKVSAYLASWGPQYPGDINDDGHIDVVDLLYFVDTFGLSEGDADFNPACDLDNSGTVDTADLLTMLANWGV